MAALGRIITSILSRDRVSSIRKFTGGVGRIGVAIGVSLVPIVLVHLFLPLKPVGPEHPAIGVLNWLGQLPTKPLFYYLVAALAGAYLGWRWCLSANLREEIRIREATEDESSLTSRDWWVIQGLRGRALAFRTLAGVLLGGVVALLFGGIYLVLFFLPQIPPSDRNLIKETQWRILIKEIQRADVKRQFGRKLQFIGEGRYWFEVADVGLGDTPISEELKIKKARLPAIALPAGTTLTRLPVLNTHEISKKELTIFAIDRGKALVSLDSGQTWSVPKGLELEEGERTVVATFGPDGRHGVVGGQGGSVFVTQDGGKTWSVPKGLVLKEGEWIVAATFGQDGRHGVVGGQKDSVFVTQDGGKTWSVPEKLELEEGERIAAATFGPDGRHGVVGGQKGSVFVTQDGGKTWSVPEKLVLKKGELMFAATFGPDSGHGVVGGQKDSVFVTQDGGKTWNVPKSLKLKEGEWIVAVTFGPDGRHGVIGGDEGSVFVTQDGGKTWSVPENSELRKDLELKEGEWIVAATFGPDGRHGVVGGHEGSVFVTQDGGKTWSVPENSELRKDLELKEGEWIVTAAFDADGRFGVVAGSEGSVFITQNSVLRWNSTEVDHQGTSSIDVVSAILGGQAFVAVDGDGGIQLLKAYPDMAEWENQSLDAMRIRIQEDEILRKSVIGREITKFLDKALSADGNVDSGEDSKPGNGEDSKSRNGEDSKSRNGEDSKSRNGEDSKSRNGKGFFSDLFDELTLMRVVTLIILFFLVQILVRLHQYSLRLATFWDSRADALLLAQSFAYHNAATFDDLVAALAPDAYDFKPSPKSGHEAVMNLAGQLLRRESRKS